MRGRRWRHAAVAAAVVLAACTAESLPRVQLPQVEQATETVQTGGERYRAHDACMKVTTSPDDLLSCMADTGWHFVDRGPGYPQAECWQARDRGDVDHLAPRCFLKTAGGAGTP